MEKFLNKTENMNKKISHPSENLSNVSSIRNLNSSPKIIIITYRIIDNNEFKPAEEILIQIILDKLGFKYEKIEHNQSYVNNLIGKLPTIYFNHKLIANKEICVFLMDILLDSTHDPQKVEMENFLFNLTGILKNQLSFANNYYHYLKIKEKVEKSINKKMFSKIRNYFNSRDNYEIISNSLLNSFSIVSGVENIYVPIENRLSDLIKNAFYKINFLITKEFSNNSFNSFFKLVIYSFLKEDKFLFNKNVKRPFIENMKYDENVIFTNIVNFYNSTEKNIINNSSVKFSLIENFTDVVKNYSIQLNPVSKKKKAETIQEYQVKTTQFHHIFQIALFSGMGLILYILANIKK